MQRDTHACTIHTATVGVITETKAEKAIESLRAYEADAATVLRHGHLTMLPAGELVPGDVVEVTVGGKVPADIRVIALLTTSLRVDQVWWHMRIAICSHWHTVHPDRGKRLGAQRRRRGATAQGGVPGHAQHAVFRNHRHRWPGPGHRRGHGTPHRHWSHSVRHVTWCTAYHVHDTGMPWRMWRRR